MCRSQHVRGRLILRAWFWTCQCTVCLLHGPVVFVVLHHMVPTCFDSYGCQLLTDGLSLMRMQHVSVQKLSCARSTHSSCMVFDASMHCLLAPWPHVFRCVAPHVTDMLCCLCLLVVDQRSLFDGHAARECVEVVMSEVDSFFVHGFGRVNALFACSMASCLYMCCTTCD